ncbi:MAG: hypothetical protein NVSMB24_03890 [Mucilaginibacter sp.]
MKNKLKPLCILLLGIVFIYTACKKSSTNPADPALTPQVIAGQVAVNISQSLFGGLGAFNVAGGLSAPSTFAVNTKGKVIQSLSNPYCGLSIDTTLNYTTGVKDTIASVSGTVKFTFTCSNNVLTGYTTNDNMTIAYSNPQLSLIYKVGENFTVLSLNPQNANSNFSINGSLTSNGSYQYKTGTKRSGTEVFNYTLTGLIVNPNTGDIVSGSASFLTSGSGPKGVWNYQGTITFLGNHNATVNIAGKVYNVTV